MSQKQRLFSGKLELAVGARLHTAETFALGVLDGETAQAMRSFEDECVVWIGDERIPLTLDEYEEIKRLTLGTR